eukprot:scaffold110795_cov33-Prasinocladus_malaysianus.AAC.1
MHGGASESDREELVTAAIGRMRRRPSEWAANVRHFFEVRFSHKDNPRLMTIAKCLDLRLWAGKTPRSGENIATSVCPPLE